jgi:hypothetical protein
MHMSSGCEAPRHGEIAVEDRDHPRFGEYMNYRSAMTRQLVDCSSFKQWLVDQDRYAPAEAANNHPRITAYRRWLREQCELLASKS